MRMETTLRADTKTFDKQALIDIYEQHNAELYRYAFRLLGDRDLAEECVAETFSRFLQTIKKGRTTIENVRAYLFRVAHNWVTDYYRSMSSQTLPLKADLLEENGSNPAQVVAQELEIERVRAALLQLSEEQQRVIVLRVLDEWSHEEVASVLGKTAEATRALQYRAMIALRRMLIEQEV